MFNFIFLDMLFKIPVISALVSTALSPVLVGFEASMNKYDPPPVISSSGPVPEEEVLP